MGRRRSEGDLQAITRAKQLCDCVPTVADKPPKRSRLALAPRPRDLSLDVVERLHTASLVRVREEGGVERMRERRELQRTAYVDLRALSLLALIARERGCLLGRRFEVVSKGVDDATRLLLAWARSDRRRCGGQG